ncbi:MAG: SDR family oxidoreductase [Actinomycetes bacterium]
MSQPRRRIVISGASSGIGFAVATRLCATDDVWLMGSSPDSARAALERLGSMGLRAAGASGVDVADEAAVDAAIAQAAEAMSGLDGVFVNAGMDGQAEPASGLDVAGFRRLLDVNVIGAFNVARSVLTRLTRPGTIVFNASANAVRPEANFLDYNASKAAVLSMAKTMALELGHEGVTVICLCPGYFPTRMTQEYLDDESTRDELLGLIPAGRFGELTEAGEVVDFLLSSSARFMTGSVVNLDGGRSI